MKSPAPLQRGHYYHPYNRGNNREDLFREERNYRYFLELYGHHIQPVAETFAYCLLKNHFHLLVKIKDEITQTSQVSTQTSQVSKTCEVSPPKPSQAFSNLFNAYTKAVNNAYGRTGSLFQERFQRIAVTTDRYFLQLILYIHVNPQKHGLVTDFRAWPWSSYHALGSAQPTRLNRAAMLNWFGDLPQYETFHLGQVDERVIAPLIEEDL
jgi:putative transposase